MSDIKTFYTLDEISESSDLLVPEVGDPFPVRKVSARWYCVESWPTTRCADPDDRQERLFWLMDIGRYRHDRCHWAVPAGGDDE